MPPIENLELVINKEEDAAHEFVETVVLSHGVARESVFDHDCGVEEAAAQLLGALNGEERRSGEHGADRGFLDGEVPVVHVAHEGREDFSRDAWKLDAALEVGQDLLQAGGERASHEGV
jgi:hypothetical protein